MKKTSVTLIDGPRQGNNYVVCGLYMPSELKIPVNTSGVSGGNIRYALYKIAPSMKYGEKAVKPAYSFSKWEDEGNK